MSSNVTEEDFKRCFAEKLIQAKATQAARKDLTPDQIALLYADSVIRQRPAVTDEPETVTVRRHDLFTILGGFDGSIGAPGCDEEYERLRAALKPEGE